MHLLLLFFCAVASLGNGQEVESESQALNNSETDSIEPRITLEMNPDHVKFYLFKNKKNPTQKKEIVFGNKASLLSAGLVRNKSIKIIIHGFLSGIVGAPCTTLVAAYLSRGFKNIICVDWTELAGPKYFILPNTLSAVIPISYLTYPIIVKSATIAGNRVSQFLQFLLANKIVSNPSYFHLLGHSLGAQLAATTGYNFTKTTGKKIGRITGLDPAGPVYKELPINKRLDASDATFVDVIHTNKYEFGYGPACGTVDFYANGGSGAKQPYCNKFSVILEFIAIICSHIAGVDYYVRSILGEVFTGCRCREIQNLSTATSGICKKESNKCLLPERFGEYGSLSATGTYFLPVKGNFSQSSFLPGMLLLVQIVKDLEANKTMGMMSPMEANKTMEMMDPLP